MKRISVIIPSYKPKDYIFDCLDSIYKQSIDKELFEIIIVLNGCKEPYHKEIISYLSAQTARIDVRILQTDEAGVSRARNIGIDNATGKYITFIDDDDFISPTYLEKLFGLVEKGYFPLSNLKTFNNETHKIGEDYISRAFKKYKVGEKRGIMNLRSFFSIPVGKLISKEVIRDKRFDTRFEIGEDSLFMTSISDKIKAIELTDEDCIYYRRVREGSASRRKRTRKEKLAIYSKLIQEYLMIYLHSPLKINLLFILTRIYACIRHFLKS